LGDKGRRDAVPSWGRAAIVCLLAPALFLAFAAAAPPVSAQEASAEQIKAAFLFNFAKFVEWPPGTFTEDQRVINLGYWAKEPLARAVEALQGKEVHGRKLVIRRLQDPEELKKCQIFFAADMDKKELARIMDALKGRPLLTVFDETGDFARLGGIINLTQVDDKIRFSINMANAEKCGLKISSHLLKLARGAGN
jgi:hypothetical protein